MNGMRSHVMLRLCTGLALIIGLASGAAADSPSSALGQGPAPSLPTLGQWGVLLLLVALISVGLWMLSTRRKGD